MIYYLLPAYNEAQNLEILIQKINKVSISASLEYRILVVDDKSEDNTLCLLEDLKKQYKNIYILKHHINMNLGKTLDDGLTDLLKFITDRDYVVIMDADCTHDPEVVPLMLKTLKQGYDIVVASRYQKGSCQRGLAFHRNFLSKCVNLMLKFIFPIKNLKDYTCGFRMFKASAIRKLHKKYKPFITEHGFTGTAELIIKAGNKLKLKIAEVPFTLKYDKKLGKSKMKVIKTIFRYFYLIAKLILIS